jgi:hypothetical protein
MTFNSEIFNPKDVSVRLSYGVLKTRMLLFGFIGVSLVAIGFLNMAQSIRANTRSCSQFTQDRYCDCGRGCLCGTGCGCIKNNL